MTGLLPISQDAGSGFHSFTNRSASAIWSGVIFFARSSLKPLAVGCPFDVARLYHMKALLTSCSKPPT